MAPGSLTEFLQEHRGNDGRGSRCCAEVPAELMAEIEAAVAQGFHAWKRYAAWLKTKGVTGVNSDNVQYHFDQHHHER